MNLFSKKTKLADDPKVVDVTEVSADVAGDVAAEDAPKGKKSLLQADFNFSFGKKNKNAPDELTWPSPVRPSAFMLPNYIRHRRALAKAKSTVTKILVVGLLIVAGVSGGAFALSMAAAQEAEEAELAFEDSRTQLRELSVTANFFNGLEERKSRATELLASEVDYAKVLEGVTRAMPSGAELSGFTTKFGQPCSSPDPFSPVEAIGCIDFTVNVDSLADASRLLDAANNTPSDYVNSFVVTSTSGGDDGYTLTGTANFTAATFVYRFSDDPDVETTPIDDPAVVTPDETTGAQ